MEAYVDGAAHDDEVDAHLRACAMCAAEVDDLRDAARQSAPSRWTYWAAAAVAAFVIVGGMWFLREPAVVPPVPPPAIATSTVRVDPPPVPAPALAPELDAILRQLASGVIPSAALIEDLIPPGERTRGGEEGPAELTILAPRGVVEDNRPHFRWRTRRGATYVAEVFDGAYRRVARSDELRGGEWRSSTPLDRGATYSWQVIETRGEDRMTAPSPPEPPALFRVISEVAYKELEAARGAGSHLAAGLLYAREGIVDRALEELTLAEKEHPQLPDLPRAVATLRRYQPAPTTTNPPQ